MSIEQHYKRVPNSPKIYEVLGLLRSRSHKCCIAPSNMILYNSISMNESVESIADNILERLRDDKSTIIVIAEAVKYSEFVCLYGLETLGIGNRRRV